MKNEIKRVNVDDSKKTTKKNEEFAIREAGFSKSQKCTDLETYKISGKLSEDLMNLLTENELEELVTEKVTSPFLQERYDLSEEDSIRDLMDAIPLYSTVWLTLEIEEENVKSEYRLGLNNRGCAGKDLQEFRVTVLELTAYEVGPEL